MSDDDFYNNLETIIEESKKQIIEKEKLITRENLDDEIENPEEKKKNFSYNYTSLVIPSDINSENNSKKNDDIKELINLQKNEEIEIVKQKLEEKQIEKKKKDPEKLEKKWNKARSCENKKNDSDNKKNKKKYVLENNKSLKKNKSNIRDFINLEKEIFIAKTLMYKKKTKLEDIYKYTSKKEKIINNLNKNMNKESEVFQQSLMENFQKTEELIKKFEEISSKKKKKKNQVQSLNIEISKLDVEYEKKEEKIKELDKYKFFLNKLANSDNLDDVLFNENQNEEKEDNFSKKMEKYIKNSQLLIDNFNLLEEKHLQLIDDTQNAEYELEEYEKKYEEKKKAFEIKNNEMDKKIKDISNFIKEHNDKISEYENLIKNNQDQISFNNINNKIDYICTQFSYDINTDEIMKKLQIMENKIYSYITTLTKYTEENSQLVYEYQREREQERRKQMRFEINLDRKSNNQNKQLKSKKINNKNFPTNFKDKKEKRENIYVKFEKDLFK
ncbi:conserved Plasmodium protein, unknown function [Plasmodium relictum]|uniref:DUF4200 domain-containing protein n=1 Tax=Plasmodium relictum TaxID=85471 RepID=A0A1J1H670_PLARL|nr:conserved Plasmodium protein, unknown function [Plasmodium relictum]CRG99098.1 conserved Plasmodium protein, unknown function [Plasmodium relictum]